MNLTIHIKQATINLDGGFPAGQFIGGSLSDFAVPQFAEACTVPQVGQAWPEQGGVLAGIMPAEDGRPAYYLIVPTSGAAEANPYAWGEYGTKVECLSASDGKANTEILAARGKHPAAEFCANLDLGGFQDYYLPSRREASLMAATVPHLFQEGWHWTSSQYSANYAFIQDFSDGRQGRYGKCFTLRVRAVRRFIIH